MNKWNRYPDTTPGDETVLCLLSNGQQVTLVLDDDNKEWVMYNEDVLEDAHVIAWRNLETKVEIEKQLLK